MYYKSKVENSTQKINKEFKFFETDMIHWTCWVDMYGRLCERFILVFLGWL